MLNQLPLAKLLRSSTYQKARDAYHHEIARCHNCPERTRQYLIHLNLFLYSYFLLEYNQDLQKITLHFERRFQEAQHSTAVLTRIGEELLDAYLSKLSGQVQASDHEIIDHALAYINKHFTKKLTLQMVADHLHISKNYLCHLFRAKTGYKFCEYVNIQRINLAKSLIAEDQKSFEYISFDCGFSSQSHFSTTFKKYAGCTPNEYRKKLQLMRRDYAH